MMVHCNCRCCDKCWLLCKEPGRYNDRGHLGLGQPHVPAVQAGTALLTLPQSRPTAIPTSEGRVRRQYFLTEGFPCSHILKHKGHVSQVIKHTQIAPFECHSIPSRS